MDTQLFPHTELGDTLRFVADLLGVTMCWYHRGSFHFCTEGPGGTVAITPESAGRYRVDRCHLTVASDTTWTAATDRARLASLVRDAAETTVGIG